MPLIRLACSIRTGITLIEVLVVISMTAVLLGLAIPLLAQLQRGVQTGRDAVTDSRTLARLAQDFRADVHAAERADLPPAAPADHGGAAPDVKLLELRLSAGRQVTYVYSAGQIRREERLAAPPADAQQPDGKPADANQAASPLRRELYRLAELRGARAELTPASPQRVSLLLERSLPSPLRARTGSDAAQPLTLTIDAFRQREQSDAKP